MLASLGGKLAYVKPHGALYNTIAKEEAVAIAVYEAIRELDDELAVMGLAGSHAKEIATSLDMHFIAEAFADRQYEPNGQLMARSKEGAVLHNPQKAADQVLSLALNQQLQTSDGNWLSIEADSVCIHGDNPAAVAILQTIDTAFAEQNILKKAD